MLTASISNQVININLIHSCSSGTLPSVSLEKVLDTAVLVLGDKPNTFSDSRRVFLLAGPLLTLVYAARDLSDIFSGGSNLRFTSS